MFYFWRGATAALVPGFLCQSGRRRPENVSILKGHSQLLHMRIRYYFLADLHVTRQAREKESEKRIRNTLNKPCRV